MARSTKRKFICLDCESTGLDPKNDRVIEIAICHFNEKSDEIFESFESLIQPGCPIPEESQNVHHITDDMVRDASPFSEVMGRVAHLVDQSVVVGHGIQFDIDLIQNEAKRINAPDPFCQCTVIDTLRLARAYGECPVCSLQGLRRHFNFDEVGAHRAMGDVITNIQVFRRLAALHKSYEAMMECLSKPILLKEMPLGKYRGRPFREIPIQYINWAVHQKFDSDLLFTLRKEIRNRKIKTSFQQASNPFCDVF